MESYLALFINVCHLKYRILILRVFRCSLTRLSFLTLTFRVANFSNSNSTQNSNETKTLTSDIEQPFRATEEKQEVTKFSDDTNVILTSLPTSSSPPFTKMGKPETNEIAGVLSRPTVISTGNWSSTNTNVSLTPTDMSVVTPLVDIDFPSALIAGNQQIANKISGFAYLRATLVIRVLVNAIPFQQGKLFGVFRPFYTAGVRDQSHNHICGLSSYPHLELDAGTGRSAELSVPYVIQNHAWGLTDISSQQLGRFQLFVLNTLTSSEAPTSCSYTVYAYFKHPELMMPTGLPLDIPSVLSVERRGETTFIKGIQSKSSKKPYEQADDSTSTPFANIPSRAFNVRQDVDMSIPLQISRDVSTSDNSVGLECDSISEICKRESLLTRFNWSASNTNGQELFDYPISPSSAQRAGTVTFHNILSYVSSLFSLWNGTMTYRFSIAKTAYHSGRLRISYVPGAFNSSLAFDEDNTYSTVWDVRETDTCVFSIPFVSEYDACSANHANVSGASARYLYNGRIYVTVINPLVAASTVSDTVTINVWHSSPDMKFYFNKDRKEVPHVLIPVPPSSVSKITPKADEASLPTIKAKPVEHTADEASLPIIKAKPVEQVYDHDDTDEGGMTTRVDKIFPSMNPQPIAPGHVSSITDLTKRFTLFATGTSTNGVSFCLPYFTPPGLSSGTSYSLLDRLSYLFGFVSGSQRFKFIYAPGQALNSLTTSEIASYVDSTASFIPEDDYPAHLQNNSLNNIVEILIPQNSVSLRFATNQNGDQLDLLVPFVKSSLFPRPTTSTPIFILRSGGADFKFEYLLGPPATLH